MNIKMKINRFLYVFLLFLTFLSVLASPVFAIKPSERITVGARLKEYKPPKRVHCDINVPSQYTTIQAGIDAAVNGDTVCVGKGIYNEDVIINKEIRLSGRGVRKTEINGQGRIWPGTVYITAKNVTFEGFFINGVAPTAAVQLAVNELPYDSTLQYNRMKAGYGAMALQLDNFQNTLVQNNLIEGNNSPHVVRES